MMEQNQREVPELNGYKEDPWLEKMIIVFLILMILALFFIPSEWLVKWSMWWNNIK